MKIKLTKVIDIKDLTQKDIKQLDEVSLRRVLNALLKPAKANPTTTTDKPAKAKSSGMLRNLAKKSTASKVPTPTEETIIVPTIMEDYLDDLKEM